MRIRLRQPRFNPCYPLGFVVAGIIILLRLTRRTDFDEFSNTNVDQPPRRGENLDRMIRNSGHELVDQLLVNRLPQQRQQPVDYDGPFPDSRAPEGVQLELVDYHDYEQAALDKERVGLGERAVAASVPSAMEKELNASYWTNGFNGLLSDMIALDRAVPDIRHPTCSTYRYYKQLPTVSVVIPFFEEQLSALQRTVMSVVNRSPEHLLKEIILVDDGSTTREDLNGPLEDWVTEHAPMTRVLRLAERQGLITARQTGAREAVGDVILVLDSHCEVMTNWLPPLLNPIAENYRTAVCPLIDIITWDTFAYHPQDNGARGAFDWNFFYKRIPLPPEQDKLLPAPFPNPVMNGGLFAISRKFFWELGGYDPGLAIWGGEQYDLSFKIWQCGGRMLDVPCSRVGHVFRGHQTNMPAAKKKNYITKNYKRVAVVWMDEYIEALYLKKPEMRHVDAGDVSRELAIRESLQCKPFKWFLENVAPDLLKLYPPFEPADFASGTISSLFNEMCLDTGSRTSGDALLYRCHGGSNQRFAWCWRQSIRFPNDQFCLGHGNGQARSPIFQHCDINDSPSHQKWKYNPITKVLQDGPGHLCLEAETSSQAIMAPCIEGNSKQQWEFQHVNMDRIREVFPEIR